MERGWGKQEQKGEDFLNGNLRRGGVKNVRNSGERKLDDEEKHTRRTSVTFGVPKNTK